MCPLKCKRIEGGGGAQEKRMAREKKRKKKKNKNKRRRRRRKKRGHRERNKVEQEVEEEDARGGSSQSSGWVSTRPVIIGAYLHEHTSNVPNQTSYAARTSRYHCALRVYKPRPCLFGRVKKKDGRRGQKKERTAPILLPTYRSKRIAINENY